MKLPRKIFAATMIVALLVMLLPQVGLADAGNTECPTGTFLAKYETGTGWENGVSGGINLTLLTTNPFVSGTWTSTYRITRMVFKDGVTGTPNYTLHGYVTYTPGVFSGAFDFVPATDTWGAGQQPDPTIPAVSSPWTWLPVPTPPDPYPYVGQWPGNKNISHIEFCTDWTAVTLDSFSASTAGGQVKLAWKTASETNNAGFNLYRATSLDAGQLVQVNRGLIAASMEAVDGASYSFVDKPGAGTFYYWLEDVDFAGKTVRHGPVKVSVKALLRRPVYRPLGPAY